jgi:hypothetical protein
MYTVNGQEWTKTSSPIAVPWSGLVEAPELGLICAVASDNTGGAPIDNIMTADLSILDTGGQFADVVEA